MSEPKYVPLDDATAETATATGDRIREAVSRLAAMDEPDYIACRRNEARDLGMNVSELNRMVRDARKACGDAGHGLKVESPEPWLEAVDGVKLLDTIEQALQKYLVLPKYAAPTIALWIMHTHLFPFDVWDVSPRLAVLAPERGCGKTQVLKVLLRLVCKPYQSASMTPATIYRIVHETQPTMLIDEYDSHGAGSEAMRNIMNAAHEKEFAWIDRCDANTNEQRFRAWAAIAVAGIGQLPGTLADRSIIIPMQRRKASEQIADLSEDEAKAELHQLQRMAYRWAQDNAEAVRGHKPEKLPWLINRDADNWKVVLRIADIVGARWPVLAREAAHHFVVEVEREDSRAIQLISDIREMFVGHGPGCRQLQSDTIVTNLLNMEERPYNEWTRQGRPINKTTLASALKPYHVYPDGLHFPELQKTLRGYHRWQVEEAHERYVGAEANSSSPHTPNSTCKTVRTPGNPPVWGDSRVQEKSNLAGNLTGENAKKPEKTATSYSLTGESESLEEKTKNTTPTEEPEHEPHIWGGEWEEAI